MSDVTVRNNPEQHRYEAVIEGDVAGFAAYSLDEGRITFTHTEVDDRFEGQGVGSTLARSALDDVRADGSRAVQPQCAFIKAWIDKHPDYADLVA